MKKNKKQGFSLIEIMILFTILSVILAATMPLISRKSHPVPQKLPHGVYRCLYITNADGEKELHEQLFTASRLVSDDVLNPLNGDRCVFQVPNATMFKIDMYSAGTGGTESVTINSSQLSDGSIGEYTLDGSLHEDAITAPSDEQLRALLEGQTIVATIQTSPAAMGGYGRIRGNTSIFNTECVVPVMNAQTYFNRYQEALNKYNELVGSTDYNSDELDAEEAAKNELDSAISDYVYIWAHKQVYNAVNELNDRLQSDVFSDQIIYEGKDVPTNDMLDFKLYLQNNFSDFYYNVLYASEDDYNNIIWGDGNKFKYANSSSSSDFARSIMVYEDISIKGKNTDEVLTIHKGNLQEVIIKLLNGEYAVNQSDVQNIKKLSELYQQSVVSAINDFKRTDVVANAQQDLDDILSGTTGLSHVSDTCSLVIMPILNRQLSGRGTLEAALENLEIKLDNYHKAKEDREKADQDHEDAIAEAEKDYKEKLERYQKEINSEYSISNYFDSYNPEDGINPYKGQKAKNEQKMIIQRDDNGNLTGDMYRQLVDYCRALYTPEDLDKQETNEVLRVTETHAFSSGLPQKGGSGVYMRIKIPIQFPEGVDKYTNSTTPFMDYARDLVSDSSAYSYYPVICDQVNGVLTNCSKHQNIVTTYTSTQGTLREPDDVSTENLFREINSGSSAIFSSSGNNIYTMKTRTGDSVSKFAAWHAPTYYFDSNPNVTILTKLPKGGMGGTLTVEENTNTYVRPSEITLEANDVKRAQSVIKAGDFSWKLNNPHEHLPVENNAGANAETRQGGHTVRNEMYNQTYTIDAAISGDPNGHGAGRDNPLVDIPSVQVKSYLWQKTYTVGAPGLPGTEVHLNDTNLGKQCFIVVPSGGRVFDPFYARVAHGYRTNLQMSIMSGITCYSEFTNDFNHPEGEIVYQHDLQGPQYTPDVISNKDSFVWTRGVGPKTVEAEIPLARTWQFTSLWARIFRRWMSVNNGNVYDLASYGIGQAGAGTTLTDSCIAPKGYFKVRPKRTIVYRGGQFDTLMGPEALFKDGNTWKTQEELGNNDENTWSNEDLEGGDGRNAEGINCYLSPEKEAKEAQGETVSTDTFEVAPDKGGAHLYYSDQFEFHAGEGGGGAVVITW